MKILQGGVTRPKGFFATAMSVGIKERGKLDLSLIVSEKPCATAGVFTRNSVKAAPLEVTAKHLRDGKAQAIIANSGNANCFTGKFGLIYAKQTADVVAEKLGCASTDVLVASTGIIGKSLPIKKIISAVPHLVQGLGRSLKKDALAAKGIMTTDNVYKHIAVRVMIGKKPVVIAGCAKGSGMIEPNMATMLGFLTTDASIDVKILKIALRTAVEASFNRITVDGCMSTNDMVTVMANGMAKNSCIRSVKGKAYKIFLQSLTCVCMGLAKKIVRDGEGATRDIEVTVSGAKTEAMALKVAKGIANSNLVKTARYGKDANWGRIAAAVGAVGIKGVNEETLKISTQVQSSGDVIIDVDLGAGKAAASVLTCNLTAGYIKINGAYN